MNMEQVTGDWRAPRKNERVLVSELAFPDVELSIDSVLGCNQYAEWQVQASCDAGIAHSYTLWVERRQVWGTHGQNYSWKVTNPNKAREAKSRAQDGDAP